MSTYFDRVRKRNAYMDRESRFQTNELEPVSAAKLRRMQEREPDRRNSCAAPRRAFQNKRFLVQEFGEADGVLRLSINRKRLNKHGDWQGGIDWEELQSLKDQLYPDRDAVEVYPQAGDVVNVKNIRHLWVLPFPCDFAWRAKAEDDSPLDSEPEKSTTQ